MAISLPDISLRQLEYLIAIADAPTWSIAAERVGVSASALSQGLAELERRVGVDLFENQGRRRVLRDAAQPMLDHARQVVAATGDLLDWSDRVQGGVVGTLRVGMIDTAAVTHFSEVVRAFRSERDDVEFRLTVSPSARLLELLQGGEIDLAVAVEPSGALAGVSSEPLRTEPLMVLAPPACSDDIGYPERWGPWLAFPDGSHTRQQTLAALGRLGAPSSIAAESHQPDVLIEMVRMGLGWAVLPIDRAHPPTGVVVGQQVMSRQLLLMRRSGVVADPVVDAFADRLRAH